MGLDKNHTIPHMKKILLATMEFPPQVGGIASYVRQLARALGAQNVVVYAPRMAEDRSHDEQESYKVVRATQLFPKVLWPRWVRAVVQMVKIIKKERIEVVLVNHVLPLGYAALCAKKIRKTPYIIISHGTDVTVALERPWKRRMLARVLRGAEQVVFNSDSLQRRFLEHMPEFASKCVVMYPCPDKQFLSPVPVEKINELRRSLALEGKKVILSVSRMEDGKGFPHLVRAMPDILKREPHTVWIIIGDGSKKQEVLQEIQKNSLQNVVRYLGEMSHEELPVYYQLADVFVLLTHPDHGREEGLGLVFLEASASGLPVVAGRSGGVEEAIISGTTGIVLDVRHDFAQIVDAVCEMLHDPEYRMKVGAIAKERIITTFNWETQLQVLRPWIE